MSPKLAARDADKGLGVNRYQRHQPEQTLLYQLIEQHYPKVQGHPLFVLNNSLAKLNFL